MFFVLPRLLAALPFCCPTIITTTIAYQKPSSASGPRHTLPSHVTSHHFFHPLQTPDLQIRSSQIIIKTNFITNTTQTMLLPTTSLPPASTLPTLPSSTQSTILSLLFEPSPSLHTTLSPLLQTPHPSYSSLISSIKSHLLSLRTTDPTLLLSILSSHPRLGAKKVESAQSQAEQAKLQEGAKEEGEELARLNEEYERVFPGLRFVVWVNGRGRGEIMGVMRERIDGGSWEGERDGGIEVSLSSYCFFPLSFLLVSGFF